MQGTDRKRQRPLDCDLRVANRGLYSRRDEGGERRLVGWNLLRRRRAGNEEHAGDDRGAQPLVYARPDKHTRAKARTMMTTALNIERPK